MLCILFYYYCGVNLVNNMLCHWRMFMSISIMRIFLLLFVQLICCQNIDVVIENHENILLQSIQWLHMIEIDAAQLWKFFQGSSFTLSLDNWVHALHLKNMHENYCQLDNDCSIFYALIDIRYFFLCSHH